MEIKLSVDKLTIKSSQDIFYIMQQILKREKKQKKYDDSKEHFWVIALNSSNKIVNIELVSIGISDQVQVEPIDILSIPLQKKAKGVVLVHNHPNGRLEPSEEDKDATNRFIQACKIMGITVCDHVIITEHSYYSFESSGLLDLLASSRKYMLAPALEKELYEDYEAKAEYLRKESEKKIKEGAKKWLNKGKVEGEKLGLEKGKLETAKNMLAKNLTIELISDITGLSVEKIKSLGR
ncbi:MAG: JAB domain-containing protein [Cyclobacteriaceae bacterium]